MGQNIFYLMELCYQNNIEFVNHLDSFQLKSRKIVNSIKTGTHRDVKIINDREEKLCKGVVSKI